MTAIRARFHDLVVDGVVEASLENPFEEFLGPSFEGDANREPDLCYQLFRCAGVAEPPNADYTPSFYQDHIQAYVGPEGFVFWDGASRVDVTENQRKITAQLAQRTLENKLGRQTLFELVFALCLRSFGIFQLHAGAIVQKGRCILIPGPSGAGKSTATLALTFAGARHMTDERAFLRRTRRGVQVLAIREAARVRSKTMEAYQDLLALPVLPPTDDLGKALVLLEKWGYSHSAQAQNPSHLFFPHVAESVETRLTPLDKAEAFGRLLLCSSLLAVPGAVARDEHMETLRVLVDGSHGWDVALGSDLLVDPKRWGASVLAELLATG